MRETRRLLRTPTGPALLAALALGAASACSNEEEPAPPEQENIPETDEIPDPGLSGLVFFHHADHEFFLTFHDPEDGSLDTRVSVQDLVLTAEEDTGGFDPARSEEITFSPGFGHTVTPTDGGLLLGAIDEQRAAYEQVTTIAPTAGPDPEGPGTEGPAFEEGEVTYESPQFSPDGSHLWFEEKAEGQGGSSRLLAVDLSTPEAQPEFVGEAPTSSMPAAQAEEEWANRNTRNLSEPENAYAISEAEEPTVYTEPEGTNDAGLKFLADDETGDIMPWNFIRGGDGTFIGPLDGSAEETDHPELSVFDLTADGTVSDEEVLVEAEDNPVHRYWYDSDGDRLLLKTDDGYYWQEIDAGGEPELAFDALDFGDDELANDELPLGLHAPLN
ncbi:hypothetical protein [Nocardiopsis salina]|uniref:hypothetical protein n=1 Tax=Nocardiopsis salina TaxID=245836 RepID=UPI00034586D8|nr:hypothetical protein [Nocardiopsis salina]